MQWSFCCYALYAARYSIPWRKLDDPAFLQRGDGRFSDQETVPMTGIEARFHPSDLAGESYSAGTDFSLALLLSMDRNLSCSAIM